MDALNRITLKGWKSIREASIDFRPLTVLVGANGVGKSNLISFFKLLNEMIGGRLQTFVGLSGGADSVLHHGSRTTPVMAAEIEFETDAGSNTYDMRLAYAAVDALIFTEERFKFHKPDAPRPYDQSLGAGHRESLLNLAAQDNPTAKFIHQLLSRCRVYQFHDTSLTARIRQHGYIDNDRFLFPHGGNLAAILFRYKQVNAVVYRRIVQTIRQIAPFFDDFELEPSRMNERNIILNWREVGRDDPFGPHQLSDGTLRVMALATLLLQPVDEMPAVIVIDEPELGLHPYAIDVLAALLEKASSHCQILVSTQSAALVDRVDPSDVVVVERVDAASTFRRLEPEKLEQWLEDYSLGELWEKNVFGGGPH